ncbi:MAG TPA: PAAR domain-containing protein [Polyangiaceae bacterium]|nr:PAAR domain-containing protein [Polyangiaceae bacterium]
MPAAARVGDMHACPIPSPSPHVGGPIMPPGCTTVMIGGQPAARLGDMAGCSGPSDVIITGSSTVMIGGQPAARMGDSTAHGGSILLGDLSVNIGG